MSRSEYEERLRGVRLLATDVDGVWTSGKIVYLEDDQEAKVFHVRDGSAIYMARLIGLRTAVITGRRSRAVARRMQELPVGDVRQGVLDKVGACRELQERHGIDDEQVAYIGDDLLDLPLLERVGVGITVADGHPRVLDRADWVTESVGGGGAVREVVDDIIGARDLWEVVMADYYQRQSETGVGIPADGGEG